MTEQPHQWQGSCCRECEADVSWCDNAPPFIERRREAVARWLFERQEEMRSLCSPEDAYWHEWVERNREEWREVADELIAFIQAQVAQ